MFARLLSSLLLGASIVGVVAGAQQPQTPPQPAGYIVGKVVDSATNAPLQGVLVTLNTIQTASAGGSRPLETRVLTDAEGRFLLRGIPAGSYFINTSGGGSNGFSPNGFVVSGMGFPIGGYLNGGFGQRRPNGPLQPVDFTEGERLGDVVIRMWKAGVISGRVIDEAGEPIVGQVVGVVQTDSGGRLLTGPTVRTDDEGAYRISGLMPGFYVVFVPQTQVSMPVSIGDEIATGPPDPTAVTRYSMASAPSPRLGGIRLGTSLISTVPETANYGAGSLISNAIAPVRAGDAIFVYPTTFHPSATRVSQAARIQVRPGASETADVQLKPVRAGAVSGVVTDEAGPVPGIGLHLMPADMGREASILEAAQTASDGRGNFSFPAAPAGQYTIIAWRQGSVPGEQPTATTRTGELSGAWARQPVTVGARAIDNVPVTMQRPWTVSGHVAFEGAADRPTVERLKSSGIITIFAMDPIFRSPGAASGSSIDGTNGNRIAISRVSPPGRFGFGPPSLPPPWTLQSITIGGRDVTDAAFELAGADVSDVVVTYTDRPASLSGSVALPPGETGVSVFVFPAARARWPDARRSARTFRVVRTTKTGTFSWPTAIPGDYLAVAIQDDLAGDWPDESFLARLAAVATPIRISANQPATLALKLSVLK